MISANTNVIIIKLSALHYSRFKRKRNQAYEVISFALQSSNVFNVDAQVMLCCSTGQNIQNGPSKICERQPL